VDHYRQDSSRGIVEIFRKSIDWRRDITLSMMAAMLLFAPGSIRGQSAADPTSGTVSGSKNDAATVAEGQTTNKLADSGQAVPSWRGPVHIVPFGPPAKPPQARSTILPASSNQGQVQYYGGPVISNVNVVEVLWGSFVDVPSTTGLDQFFTDITDSNYFALLAEYGTVGLNGNGTGNPPGSNQKIGSGVFGGKFTITPSLCPGSAANPPSFCSIDDTQIQTELANQVSAGHLPQAVQDTQGNFNTIYMIYFPPGVTITVQGIESCAAFGFCAYHSNIDSSLRPKLLYGVFPDFGPTSGCSAAGQGCGSGASQQNLSSASSHELAEATTDAQVGSFSGSVPAPPLAWIDQKSGQEIGDFCNQDQVQISVNSRAYTVQQLFSNMQGACVSAPAHFQLTAQADANPGKPFNLTVTPQSSVDNSVLSGYNNTVHFTSSDPAAVLPADYTFAPGSDAGTHTFSVTSSASGSQTVTVTDTEVLAMAGSAAITLSNFPDLGVTSTHAVNFTQGQTGAIYTLTVTNTGNLPTSGQVTVIDSLPGVLTASAISGPGWSCVLGTLTCTRSDALAANTSYPQITLMVNVSPTAPTPLVNAAQVSVNGDLNPSNDTAMDNTVVVQLADLTISKTHAGSFVQGETGATYTLVVNNVGNGQISAPVTVVDTLPTGLTATNAVGGGWICPTLSPPTCTRDDNLNPGHSYPPITLTVNVDPAAPMPTVTNTATVSGGGEVITNNDTANDVTTITPPAAILAVTSAHNGNFTQGQMGVYTLTVSNVGPASTNAVVTVTDMLPLDLSVSTISGTGWNCPPVNPGATTASCTRSDVLASQNSYPPLTLTANVSATAPTPLANMVSVAGGGDPNTGSASDLTTINQLPDLALNGPSPNTLTAGATGATNTYVVSNVGLTPTIGTVTFTDTVSANATPTNLAGAGWNCTLSTLTCTRSDSLAPSGTYPSIVLTMNYAVTATKVLETPLVSGGGEANTANDGFDLTEELNAPISIQSNAPAATVAAGGTATITFGVGDFLAPEAITFACSSGVPPGATCAFNPTTQTTAGANITLTITTTGPNSASVLPSDEKRTPRLYALLFPALGLAAIALCGRKRSMVRLTASLAWVLLLTLSGCGGGGIHGPPPVVTPPGMYTITVTATNSTVNTQVSLPVTLTVQ
jgi:uncharacterized repeat protein (TIGR01451 family)